MVHTSITPRVLARGPKSLTNYKHTRTLLKTVNTKQNALLHLKHYLFEITNRKKASPLWAVSYDKTLLFHYTNYFNIYSK